ncbi:hypothetical protein MC378_14160 [Polaribacter sp. MSW13]|uniref:Uncharacterized protein n=1 Tax=Polaribacter marinus TaxID=2916838 RepID=A0A9X1VPD1_9FLAO|nr:hypothetical protein [Polaribacter marinus]MCI2230319.1 hypothetical protein [Polaribacter marinus]
MRVVYTYDVENLKKIQEIINGYNPKEIPVLTTQINHIRENGKVRLRLTINGNDNDVQNLVNLLHQ